MELFNKSKRTFTLNAGVLAPEKNITVSDAEGKLLITQYAGEIIQIGNSEIEKENEKLKKEIKQLKNKKTT